MKYMEYGEYKETLQAMIHQLLSGDWSLSRFQSDFSKFYLEEVPSELLSDDEWLFYFKIIDRFDCISTTLAPKSDREFIDWLQNQRIK
jgi:hypothetical protein